MEATPVSKGYSKIPAGLSEARRKVEYGPPWKIPKLTVGALLTHVPGKKSIMTLASGLHWSQGRTATGMANRIKVMMIAQTSQLIHFHKLFARFRSVRANDIFAMVVPIVRIERLLKP